MASQKPRRSGSRMPKSDDTVRAHVQMPPDWRRSIDRMAKKLNMSRSSFIAKAAYMVSQSGAFPTDTAVK